MNWAQMHSKSWSCFIVWTRNLSFISSSPSFCKSSINALKTLDAYWGRIKIKIKIIQAWHRTFKDMRPVVGMVHTVSAQLCSALFAFSTLCFVVVVFRIRELSVCICVCVCLCLCACVCVCAFTHAHTEQTWVCTCFHDCVWCVYIYTT